MTITWKKVHIGGGGYVLGGQMSADGTLFICKTDVFGGYVYNFTTHIWDQVIRPSKFPPQALVGQGPNKTPPADGFSEFRFAKSNLDVMYACYLSKIYKSTNRGASFVELTGYGSHTMEANNGAAHSRKATPRMDIDPINPNVVYVCTDTEGVFKTTDGGTTWGNIGLPGNANSDHPGLVCFDQTSSPIGGKTGTVYISVDGFGLYKSTDAGVTWPGSPMTGSPTKIIQLKQATNGKIAMVNHDVSIAGTTGTPYQLYKLVGTTFTEISPFLTKGAHSQQWNHNVAIDPSSPDHILSCSDHGFLLESFNFGTTWPTAYISVGQDVLPGDVPWLAEGGFTNLGCGELIFDTQTANKVWLLEGVGVWTSSIAGGVTQPPARQTWTVNSAGIEELVSYYALCPNRPGALPVFVSGDRTIVTPDTGDPTFQAYQIHHQWEHGLPFLLEGPGCDWASSDPSFLIVSAYSEDATSTDGGLTWTKNSVQMPRSSGISDDIQRAVACSTPLNWLIIPAHSTPQYTTNGGASYAAITPSGVPTFPSAMGWNTGGVNTPIVGCCADRVLANTFYIYNQGVEGGTSGGTVGGIYKSTNGGVSWTHPFVGRILNSDYTAFGLRLRSVPGQAGHLFIMNGHVGAGGGSEPVTSSTMMRSNDGGLNWSTVANVAEVGDIDFGPVPSGGSYPSIFICGWVFQGGTWVHGVFRSDDNCATWINYGYMQPDWGAPTTAVGADKNIFGRVFIGHQSSGYAFADSDEVTPPVAAANSSRSRVRSR